MMAGRGLVKRFVSYEGNYVFPVEQKSLTSNFANVKTRTTPLAGFDGGYDELGVRRAPQEIGTLQVSSKMIATQGRSTQAMMDAWRSMAGWGPGRLLMLPMDAVNTRRQMRWAYARLTYATPNINVQDSPEVYLDAEATFNVPDPGWYGIVPGPAEPAYNAAGVVYFDDDMLLDGSWVWGGPRVVATVNGGQTITATNSGTRVTRPIITLRASTTTNNLGMARLNRLGQPVDEWRYNGTLLAGEALVLDCGAFSVVKATAIQELNAFADFQIVRGLGWHELPPGDTTLVLTGTVSGVTVSAEYDDSWY